MTGYTKEQVDEMRANLCARWDNVWALLECRVKAAQMLDRLYNAWRDSVSQNNELCSQVDEARALAVNLNDLLKEIRKQRDDARLEVARLKGVAAPYMGQIMAECDCGMPGICEKQGCCEAERMCS